MSMAYIVMAYIVVVVVMAHIVMALYRCGSRDRSHNLCADT